MSKKLKTQHAPQSMQDRPQEPKKSWIELATETEPLSAIPVRPVFQADLPNQASNCRDPDSIKWLGVRIWPLQESEENCNDSIQENNKEVTGEGKPEICTCQSPGSGRPEICSCQSPGSVECVSRHVSEERNRLKTELGPAFEEWKFDQMGEVASSGWSLREEKRFEALLKRNLSANQSLVESSWKSFRNKDRKSLVTYYFNVYIPRKISQQTKSGCTEVDTDDDDVPSNSQKLKSEELEPNNDSEKTGSKPGANDNEASKFQKGGKKSETAEDERSQSKSSESQKKSANYAGKNKYLSGRR